MLLNNNHNKKNLVRFDQKHKKNKQILFNYYKYN